MGFDIDEKSLDSLAAKIARAMVTAHDDAADEMIAGWPDDVRRRVPDRASATGAERLAAARRLEAEAQAAQTRLDFEAKREAERQKRLEDEQAARDAALLESERLRFERDTATYHHRRHEARQAGRPEPAKPAPLRTLEQLRLDERRAAYR